MADQFDITPRKRTRLSRDEKKAQTRSRLLEAAQELFALQGFEGPSIDEIAETAGYSRGAFYANFSDKLDLMKHLIQQGFDSDIEAVKEMAAAASTEEEIATGYLEYARRFHENPRGILWVLEFQLSVIRHPELRDEYLNQHAKLRSEVAKLVTAMFSSLKDRESIAALTNIFIGLQTGLSMLRVLDKSAVSEEVFREAFDLIVAGVNSKGEQ